MKKHKMTKRLILALGIIGLSVTGVRADSVNEKEITYADPTIYVENGKYYLTGTRNQEPLGFAILESDRKSTRLNSSHPSRSRMPSSA